mmetsp:Transcript_87009/g.232015  ORF Transcript_87009/g.232015 Transcript_87009/m.232015 type:complete len:275 (-) Transcript_87009:533-1357(-)
MPCADGGMRSIRLPRPKRILTAQQAIEVFRLKDKHGCKSVHSASVRVGNQFHVSSKTVRDIWNGRSWLDVTSDLWSGDERPLRNAVGRPRVVKGKGFKTDNSAVARAPVNEEPTQRDSLVPDNGQHQDSSLTAKRGVEYISDRLTQFDRSLNPVFQHFTTHTSIPATIAELQQQSTFGDIMTRLALQNCIISQFLPGTQTINAAPPTEPAINDQLLAVLINQQQQRFSANNIPSLTAAPWIIPRLLPNASFPLSLPPIICPGGEPKPIAYRVDR